jgi:hypothetical protein
MKARKSATRRRKKTAVKTARTLSATGIAARKKLELGVKNVNKQLKNLIDWHYFAA